MFYWRYETEEIRQGFNFYPPNDGGSVGCQMMFGRLRIEVRWSRRTKKLRIGWWLRTYAKPPEESAVYIPGYTDEMKELYEANHYNNYWGKKYEDWVSTKDIELKEEKQPVPSKNKRRSTAWVK